jgi:hypothetical protein
MFLTCGGPKPLGHWIAHLGAADEGENPISTVGRKRIFNLRENGAAGDEYYA